jgi:hypothetical protein
MIPRDSRLTRHPNCLTNGVHLTLLRKRWLRTAACFVDFRHSRFGEPVRSLHIAQNALVGRIGAENWKASPGRPWRCYGALTLWPFRLRHLRVDFAARASMEPPGRDFVCGGHERRTWAEAVQPGQTQCRADTAEGCRVVAVDRRCDCRKVRRQRSDGGEASG